MKKGMARRDIIAVATMAVVGLVALVGALPLNSSADLQAQAGSSSSGSITPVASKIRYQGQLKDDAGNPLDGIYDMEFQLWTADTGGNEVGDVVTIPGVCVTNGLFSVVLPVEASQFDGKALWVEVKIDGYTYGPRQEILSVPYALHSLSPPLQVHKFDLSATPPHDIDIYTNGDTYLDASWIVDMPFFCVDGMCSIWLWLDKGEMGAVQFPGVLGPVWYHQDPSDGHYFVGPGQIYIAGFGLPGGDGINGGPGGGSIFIDGYITDYADNIDHMFVILSDDGAEHSPDQWTADLEIEYSSPPDPLPGDLTDLVPPAVFYFCPCAGSAR